MARSRRPITPTDPLVGPVRRDWATPAALVAYALGMAVMLTLCDWAGHVAWDVLVYRDPPPGSLLPGQPTVRVFVGFLALSAVLTAVAWQAFGRLIPPPARVTAATLVVFVGGYLLSGVLNAWPMVLVVGLMLAWVAQLAWFRAPDRLYAVVVLSVVLAVAGPLVEGLYSTTGFFAYRDDAVFGVPAWLGPLYLNGALAVVASITTLSAWLRDRHSPAVR